MATPVELPTNHSYDPYDQSFILTSPDGVTPFPAQLASLLVLQANATSQAIIYGVQIGMCGLLFAVMTIMAKADKRRSAVYILNSLALLFLLLRNILACAQLSGIFYNYYNWQLHWYPDVQMVRNAQKVSIVTEVSNLLIDVAIYSSLVLQVHIVCCTLSRLYQRLIIFISILVCLITTSIRLALVVINVKFMILGLRNVHVWQSLLVSKVASVLNITSVVSIALFSVIFVVKLAFAIHLRRKLNMKQFGPMQIIFIMGCQTLFIPCECCHSSFFITKLTTIQCSSPSSPTLSSAAPRSTASCQPSLPSFSHSPACGPQQRRPTVSQHAATNIALFPSASPSTAAPANRTAARQRAAVPTRPTLLSTTTSAR